MIAEITQIQEQLQERWSIFWIALVFGFLALSISWRQGLFRFFPVNYFPIIRGIDVIKGFAYFLSTELLFIPALIGIAFMAAGKDIQEMLNQYPQWKGWINLIIMWGGFGAVALAYFELSPMQRQALWGQTHTSWYRHFLIGVVVWIVSYPLVVAFSQLLSIALWHFFHHPFVEQVAVQNVRQTLKDPLLFGLTSLSIVSLVPLMEEYLFRGLLQIWLKQKFNHLLPAVFLSSLVFALFHYSSHHGYTNIELLSSLFLLSCVLGFLYERQGALWAPVGLHSFFNFMSLLMIFHEPGP